MNLEEEIGTRMKLSMEEYEGLHRGIGRGLFDFINHSNKEFVLVRIGGKLTAKDGLREYAYTN
jgi:hydroxymethylglutaryl-CoA synthase